MLRKEEGRPLAAPVTTADGNRNQLNPGAQFSEDQFSQVNLGLISIEELVSSRLTPRVVVPDLLYADVRIRIAAGATGKTTVALYEAVTLALGRELWGRIPGRECKTVIVTREDTREILVARIREIMGGMRLTPDEKRTVLAHVRVIDVSGVPFRLSTIRDDVVIPHADNLRWIISKLEDWEPDWVIFDPVVSFGVGESRVNDAEQGLIEAFRILRNSLDCCIEGIHHSGKMNAREKNLDQYSNRGGSALPDGSRMVAVMQPLEREEWHQATGLPLEPDETGIVMALPKLSYVRKQVPVFIRRRGYDFTMAHVLRRTPDQEAVAIENQVWQFIQNEYSQGRRYSNQDLENSKGILGLTRDQIRSALTRLKVTGQVTYEQVRGKTGSHYIPVTIASDDGDTIGQVRPEGGDEP